MINSYAESSNPAIYHYIRGYTKSGTIPPTVYLDDTTASTDASRASLFNQYFHSVFTPPTISDSTSSPSHSDQISSLTFTEDEVYYALCQLDPNKATGIDNIGPKVLKYCAFPLTSPLCYLFNLSLSTGLVPKEWKTHLIVPVFKSVDRSSVKNYRPISLLCKVLETLVYNHIINHTLKHITKYTSVMESDALAAGTLLCASFTTYPIRCHLSSTQHLNAIALASKGLFGSEY